VELVFFGCSFSALCEFTLVFDRRTLALLVPFLVRCFFFFFFFSALCGRVFGLINVSMLYLSAMYPHR